MLVVIDERQRILTRNYTHTQDDNQAVRWQQGHAADQWTNHWENQVTTQHRWMLTIHRHCCKHCSCEATSVLQDFANNLEGEEEDERWESIPISLQKFDRCLSNNSFSLSLFVCVKKWTRRSCMLWLEDIVLRTSRKENESRNHRTSSNSIFPEVATLVYLLMTTCNKLKSDEDDQWENST